MLLLFDNNQILKGNTIETYSDLDLDIRDINLGVVCNTFSCCDNLY